MIIALTGLKGSGKDHFGLFVKNTYPDLDIRLVAFADPIKIKFLELFGSEDPSIYDELKRCTISFENDHKVVHRVEARHVLIELGMFLRNESPQRFIERVDRLHQQSPATIWIITDLRFKNEMDFIRGRQGTVIKIKRDLPILPHITEHGFCDVDVDFVIDNTRDISYFEDQILETVRLIGGISK